MAFTPPKVHSTKQWKNLRVGLFGGTFNPPHEGHLHVCDVALKTGQFDFIWWMVTPQNPLKKNQKTPGFQKRVEWSKEIVTNPRILVSDIEDQLQTFKTIDTIKELKKAFPHTEFTFLAGMDNALNLHQWEEWQTLLNLIPFMFIARPPANNLVKSCPAKMLGHKNMSWVYETKLVYQSSSALRQKSSRVEKNAKKE